MTRRGERALFHDRYGRRIRPGDTVLYRGEEREVLALWYDRTFHTDVSLVPLPGEGPPDIPHVKGSELAVLDWTAVC